MCNHGKYLQRQHRTFWRKLLGIKELYICSQCGHKIKVK